MPLTTEGLLGDAVVTDTGGVRVDGADIGSIYPVTQVIEATSGNPYATTAELPFTGTPVAVGSPVTDGQTPLHFDFVYPPNNFKMAEAHVVIDTRRDTSDTEGIFVDGVLSGRPPTNMVNVSCPSTTHNVYFGNTAGNTPNTYYIDFALTHYKQLTRNTFDLDLAELLKQTTVRAQDLLVDGFLPVVTGDDSPVYQGFLVLKGYTISKSELTCSASPTYSFENVFLHNDGPSVAASPAFTGGGVGPAASWATNPAGFASVQWFFEAQLPRVTAANIAISTGTVSLNVKRNTGAFATAAIVVNGVGVSEPGFDRTQATASVESWDSGTSETYFSNWVASVADDGLTHAVSLDLVQLLGASRLRSLILQGKLDISVAGSISRAQGSAATSTRTFGTPVSGPELSLTGTYFTELCEVPNNPASPLSDDEALPSDAGDHTSPTVSSLQASEVTSSSAVVQWLTNESATSQVGYGIGNTNTLTTNDTGMVTFHRVQLTGLQPYKVYTVRVYTSDSNGNQTVSGSKTFQTLR